MLNSLVFEKAFESVWHYGLLLNLSTSGSRGQIFVLITTYLRNTWLANQLDSNHNDAYRANQFIPQGTLSPLLLIYVGARINVWGETSESPTGITSKLKSRGVTSKNSGTMPEKWRNFQNWEVSEIKKTSEISNKPGTAQVGAISKAQK